MNKNDLSKALRLYAVTDESEDVIEKSEAALQAGITCLQYRVTGESKISEAIALRDLCRKHHVLYIINNDVKLAKQIGADGVHVGQSDMPVAEARKILGKQAIIGASVGTLAEALYAQNAGADYLGIGAMFPTPSKPEASVVPVSTLRCICTSVSIPAVAIGGIKEDNVNVLEHTGIVGIAVISAIFSSDKSIPDAVYSLQNALEHLELTTPGYSLYICDFDGTMIDSMHIWAHLAEDFLISFGKTPRPDLGEKLTNWGLRDGIIYLHDAYELPCPKEECLRRFNDMLVARYQSCNLKPGVLEFGRYVQGHDDLILRCATAGSDVAIRKVLSGNGLLKYYEPVFSSISIGIDKSNPAFYLRLLELNGARLQGSCAFDDAPFALKAAHEAGLQTVRIHDDFWNHIPAYTVPNDMTVQSLKEWVELQNKC